MKHVRMSWVLWAALAVLTLGCHNSEETGADESGSANVKVDISALSGEDITAIKVTVSGSDFSPAIMSELSKNSETAWAGTISGIPAGENRTFTAEAFDANGVEIYAGTATGVTIVEDQAASVTIYLQQTAPADPFGNSVPVITAFTASSKTVKPNDTVALTVQAVDADASDTLSYAWSADKGGFSDANSAATVWTAPASLGETEISISVSDPHGATADLTATVMVAFDQATGDADVNIQINTTPEVLGLVPTPTRVDAGESTYLDLSVLDRDDNDLTFAWSADCDGTFDDVTAEDPTFTLTTVSGDTCTLTATVTDDMGGENSANITIQTGAGAFVDYQDTDTEVCITKTFTFQQDAAGYNATLDTNLMEQDPDLSFGNEEELSADQVNSSSFPGGSESQILIRFDNIFGENGIPEDAALSAAELKVFTTSGTNDNISIHRMLADWTENSTWNAMVDGVTADDVEAIATPDDSLAAPGSGAYYSLNVIDSLNAWQGAAANLGWVVLNDGTDGWDFFASESIFTDRRPALVVEAEVCGAPDLDVDTDSDTDNDTDTDSETETETEPYVIEDVGMTPGSDETQINFNWYSNADSAGMVQIALKTDMVDDVFPEAAALSFPAVSAPAVTGYYHNKATADTVAPNTTYVYRVGNGTDSWSDTYTLTTQSADHFSFFAVGDPQIGSHNTTSDTAGWADTLNKAFTLFPDTGFIMSAGDQVNRSYNEEQFTGFFAPKEIRNLPVAPCLGNHDNNAPNHEYHFNMPNLSGVYGVTDPGSSNNYFTYGEALFIILNSNNRSGASHAAFIEEVMAAHSDAKWKIAMFHHDIYGSAHHALESSIMNLRAELFPVFDQYGIDIVITGHDHTYSRTHVMYGDVAQLNQTTDENGSLVDPNGTVYFTLNSGSGSKYYALNATVEEYTAARWQENVPTFSYVEINRDTLSFNTYRTDTMTAIDTFSIVKTGAENNVNISSTRVSDSMDDVEESTFDGAMYTDSSDLELVYDSHVNSNQVIGMRFTGIDIPQGATISTAYVQFTVDEADAETAETLIYAEAADDAAPFTTDAYNVSGRMTTEAYQNWAISEWTVVDAAGVDQRTPDLSDLIQEVVNRAGWVAGNAMAIIVTGTSGTRHAESYDGESTSAPLLYVEYTIDSTPII